MKIRILSIVALLLVGIMTSFAQNKTEEFKVYGNCGMCEKTIEKAAKAVDGVKKADWDKETKMIKVTFNTEKTNLTAIHQAIADVGYDTKEIRAKDEVYNKLHSCCKYDRAEE